MTILHIITELDKMYGAQRHVIEAINNHLNNGYHCMVITGKKGTVSAMIEAMGVKVVAISSIKNSYNIFHDALAIPAIIGAIEQLKPSLVVSHSSKASVVARIACAITKTPNIFTVHGWAFEKGVPPLQYYLGKITEQLLKPLTDQYYCVSAYTAAYGIEQLSLDTNKVHICPNLHVPALTHRFVPKPLNHNVLMVAEFRRQKDHVTAILAIEHLVYVLQMKQLHFTFVGDGKRRQAMELLITEKQLGNYITIAGETNEIDAYYAACDLVILPSLYEGLPISLIEALREGKPIIASDVGGINEIVQPGVNGFLTKVGNYEQLAIQIATCYNELLLHQFGANSWRIYQEKYDYQTIVQQMNAILHKAIRLSKYA